MFLALIPYLFGGLFLALTSFIAVFIPDLLNFVISQIPALVGSQSPQVMQFTGFGAWVADKLRFAECLSVAFVWLQFRIVLSIIPFVKNIVS